MRAQLRPGALGKAWSERAPTSRSWSSSRATIPPFFRWDFAVSVVTRGSWVSWSSPSARSRSGHAEKRRSLIISSPEIPAEALWQGREGDKPFLLCRSSPVPALVPSIQLLLPLAAAFPNPLFSPHVCSDSAAPSSARRLILCYFFLNDFLFIFESTG